MGLHFVAEKVYPYITNKKLVLGSISFILIAVFFQYILPFIFFPFIFLAIAAVAILILVLGINVKEIVITEDELIFNRRLKPIIIQKITNVERLSKIAIKVTGITKEGKTVSKSITSGNLKGFFGGKGEPLEEIQEDINKLARL